MSYSEIIPLMKKKGCALSPEKFQQKVNIVFHDHEAKYYDSMHSDMKNSLQQQIDLLISDLLKHPDFSEKKLNILDVGCGTGLSTEYLLNSKLEPFIEHITLLDSSKKMLELAEKKAITWNKKFSLFNSYVSKIQKKFDLVLICSVLHHIPDLNNFLKEIDNVMNPNGILIHLQDPNGDYLMDNIYKERVNLYLKRKHTETKKNKLTELVPKRFRNYLNRAFGRKNYIDLINDQLIKEKIINKRMTSDEIWSITDIHVETKKNILNKGISFQFLNRQLENFTLISQRSYGFYGKLKSELDKDFRKKEEEFISQNQLTGRNISCIWIKN